MPKKIKGRSYVLGVSAFADVLTKEILVGISARPEYDEGEGYSYGWQIDGVSFINSKGKLEFLKDCNFPYNFPAKLLVGKNDGDVINVTIDGYNFELLLKQQDGFSVCRTTIKEMFNQMIKQGYINNQVLMTKKAVGYTEERFKKESKIIWEKFIKTQKPHLEINE